MIGRTIGVALLALAIAACGSDGTPDEHARTTAPPTAAASVLRPTPQPFAITERAYYTEPTVGEPSRRQLFWVAVITNQNPITYGLYPTVIVTARDEGGAVVGTQDQVLGELPPDGRIAIASQLTVSSEPKTVAFAAGRVEWRQTTTRIGDYPPFAAEKVAIRHDLIFGYLVSGDVVSPYDQPVKQLMITVLLRDAGGTLLGGKTAYIEGVAAKGARPFSINAGRIPGAVASAEVLVMPTGGPGEWHRLAGP